MAGEDKKDGPASKTGGVHADADGWEQHHPDARGYGHGQEVNKADGNWHSNYPNADGWTESSTKS